VSVFRCTMAGRAIRSTGRPLQESVLPVPLPVTARLIRPALFSLTDKPGKETDMSYTVIYPKTRIARELYKDVPVIANDELLWEPDGAEEIVYEVALNLAAVEDLARKAAGNGCQISNAGPLRVRVLKRERFA
jgi:N-glycosylase/DNA lyase